MDEHPTPATLDRANRLVLDHLHVVEHVVEQLASRYPRHVDRDELWNAGAYGLVDASRRYDPAQGVPFAGYATVRVRGAVIDATRTRDWATRSLRRDLRALQDATEQVQGRTGRTATEEELAGELDVSVERLRELRAAAATSTLLHLDQQVGDADGGEGQATLADLLEERDEAVLPTSALERRELTGTLRLAIAHLPELQREVVVRSYLGGEYLHEIADSFGVSEARVSQLRSEAVRALRAYFAQSFDGVEAVDADAPGRRSRRAYLARLTEATTWRDRLAAADAVSR